MIQSDKNILSIPFEHFAMQSGDTQLFLLNFLTNSSIPERNRLNSQEALCFELLPFVSFINTKNHIEHDLLNFYLTLGLKDTNSFIKTIQFFNTQMEQKKPPETAKSYALSYLNSPHHTDTWGSAQSNIWIKVLDAFLCDPQPNNQEKLQALIASPFISFRSVYAQSMEDLACSKLPNYRPLQSASDRSRGIHPMELILSFDKPDIMEQLWDKNSEKSSWINALQSHLKKDNFSRLHYGSSTASTGPLSKLSFSSSKLWIENPMAMHFLYQKVAPSQPTTHIANQVAICFYGQSLSPDNTLYSSLFESIQKSTKTDVFFSFIKVMQMQKSFEDSNSITYTFDALQDQFIDTMISFAQKIYEPDEKYALMSQKNFNLLNTATKLQSLRHALVDTPSAFSSRLWESLDTNACALCFFERPFLYTSDVLSLLKAYPHVSRDKFLNILCLIAPQLNHFPSTTDESPFHCLIRESTPELLDAFLGKLREQNPTLLTALLTTECWTLQSLELRKKGDAFSVAVGTGDAEKLKILQKHGPSLSQDRAKETLKYLKNKNIAAHRHALSAFEKLLLENMLQDMGTTAMEGLASETPKSTRKRL